MVKRVQPTLGPGGWVEDVHERLNKAMAWAYVADASQDSVFRDSIISIPNLISMYGNNPENLSREMTSKLTEYLNRHFQAVNVSIKHGPIPGKDDSVYMIDLSIRVTHNGITSDFRNGLEVTDNSMTNVFNESNL